MSDPAAARERRVLVLASTARDAANSAKILTAAGLHCLACRDIADLCGEMAAGAGVVIVTEEAVARDKAEALLAALGRQPPWSDLPVIVLTRGGQESPAAERAMNTLGNVMLLERPIRVFTLVTAARTALRARARQYQIRGQMEELKNADARKDEFLATLAHELRNPLAPVRTGLHLLRMVELPGPAAKTRDMMDRQVGYMVRLIDDLMDVSRITRGKVQLMRERVDLRAVAEGAVDLSRPLIEAAGHRFAARLPAAPLWVDADPTRLTQVVANLLNNAAKYTPDGGTIELAATAEGSEAVVTVRDDGVGIPAAALPTVFDLFAQVGDSRERSQGGLGIGLTLVKRLTEMHGGRVTAASDGPGTGCTFAVRLPLLTADSGGRKVGIGKGVLSTQTSSAFPLPPSALKVLVVDDNVDGAESLAMMLRLSGHDTRAAHSGPAALEEGRGFRPDVFVLDIGLPGMTGYELAAALRAEAVHAGCVLVALTGYGGEADRQRATEAGFDHHLTKPAGAVEIARVFAAVKRRPG